MSITLSSGDPAAEPLSESEPLAISRRDERAWPTPQPGAEAPAGIPDDVGDSNAP
jgi:hypothetical protein